MSCFFDSQCILHCILYLQPCCRLMPEHCRHCLHPSQQPCSLTAAKLSAKNATSLFILYHECCSRHMTASSSASWSRFSPLSDFVNGPMSTVWFMACRWPQSLEGDWPRPHLCKLARHSLDQSGSGSCRKKRSNDERTEKDSAGFMDSIISYH